MSDDGNALANRLIDLRFHFAGQETTIWELVKGSARSEGARGVTVHLIRSSLPETYETSRANGQEIKKVINDLRQLKKYAEKIRDSEAWVVFPYEIIPKDMDSFIRRCDYHERFLERPAGTKKGARFAGATYNLLWALLDCGAGKEGAAKEAFAAINQEVRLSANATNVHELNTEFRRHVLTGDERKVINTSHPLLPVGTFPSLWLRVDIGSADRCVPNKELFDWAVHAGYHIDEVHGTRLMDFWKENRNLVESVREWVRGQLPGVELPYRCSFSSR